ncbi:hypothetical protein V5799_012361 [Amblyomma americanum]|uniref:Uncharacterized protein n=1 Tax=Amblyomma americanum TaxID=6943 RepID=A0AAQ4EEF6_AMBAM
MKFVVKDFNLERTDNVLPRFIVQVDHVDTIIGPTALTAPTWVIGVLIATTATTRTALAVKKAKGAQMRTMLRRVHTNKTESRKLTVGMARHKEGGGGG